MDLTLKIWRQNGPESEGELVSYSVTQVNEDMSFLEMLDVLNESLEGKGEEPIAFESDCREGICGACGCMINGQPHGHKERTTTCQLHMREFSDGDVVGIEPFRADAFPVLKDLIVERSSFDRIIQAGGYISVRTGAAPDAHAVQVNKSDADEAFDKAACIGCGACVAACPNAAAMLFTGAKVMHLGYLPQGQVERYERVGAMAEKMDEEGFGHCSNAGECAVACPKGIDLRAIARLNKDMLVSQFKLRSK